MKGEDEFENYLSKIKSVRLISQVLILLTSKFLKQKWVSMKLANKIVKSNAPNEQVLLENGRFLTVLKFFFF